MKGRALSSLAGSEVVEEGTHFGAIKYLVDEWAGCTLLRHSQSGRYYPRLWKWSTEDEDEGLPFRREFAFAWAGRRRPTCEQLSAACYMLSLMNEEAFIQSFLLLVWEKDEEWVCGKDGM